MCAFTRHKRELARLVNHGFALTPAQQRAAHVLLCTADEDGVCWIGVRQILERMPHTPRRSASRAKKPEGRSRPGPVIPRRPDEYALRTLQIALEGLRRRGFLDWEHVKVGQRPADVARRLGLPHTNRERGRRSEHGGRVFLLNLGAFRDYGSSASAIGTIRARYDQQIVAGYDQEIVASDPSRSPSEIELTNPAPALRSAAAPAAPARNTAPVPRATRDPMRLQVQVGAPDAPIARPAAAKGASETPPAAEASRASPRGPDPKREIERQGGVRGDGAGERGTPSRQVSEEQLEAFRRQMAAAGVRMPFAETSDRE